jgi:hypothetical protein
MSQNQAGEECQHEDVIVDYLGSVGPVTNLHVAALPTTILVENHPKLELINPRCAKCGATLSYEEIKRRINKGGDLYDRHFVWCEQWHSRN